MLLEVQHSNRVGLFPEVHANALPPNFREITEKEFAQSEFFHFTPRAIEFKQAPLCEGQPLSNLYMYAFNNQEGIALIADYWAGKVRYFRFGTCIHEWKHVNTGVRFEQRVQCNKCGVALTCDSSG